MKNKDNKIIKELHKEYTSSLVTKNITVMGKRTSVRLEPEMWASLKDISKREHCTVNDLCTLINIKKNDNTSLTTAIRIFLMLYFRAAATEEGHGSAGHGNFKQMAKRANLTKKQTNKYFSNFENTYTLEKSSFSFISEEN